MASLIECGVCSTLLSPFALECHVCGTQQFPNVNLARLPEERSALLERYQKARQQAKANGLEKLAQQFEQHVGNSFAVMSVKFPELRRLASSESELKATYYELADTRVPRAQPPDGLDWDYIREVVDTAVFRDKVKAHIRFAALATTPTGLRAYGPCTLVCASVHIEKRASTFEKNTCHYFMASGGIRVSHTVDIPKGVRSTWADRAKLALAKLLEQLKAGMTPTDFDALLLKAGENTADDDFIEVNIYGAVSAKTFAGVTMDEEAAQRYFASHELNDLKKNLANLGLLE